MLADDQRFLQRLQQLGQRMDHVREGGEPQPLQAWMEELYRRVSDRQTMGSVVHELRASLSEVEKQIDQYFRNPAQREQAQRRMAERGADPIVGIGFSQGSAIEKTAKDFPKLKFAIIDSVVNLPAGFAISSRDKFRNQQVMIVVEVPLGKKIEFNKNIQRYTWFDLHGNGRGSVHYSRDWDNEYDDNQDYEMTTSGLKSPPDNRPKSRIESEY